MDAASVTTPSARLESRARERFRRRGKSMQDRMGRTIDYLRISITDRCNLRCRYCMPGEGICWRPMEEILTYEEITEFCRIASGLGITKVKITGGEPLVRRGCPDLIRALKDIPGIRQVTMTTNGVLLSEYLRELLDAGLDAVNISLDSLRPDVYEQITRRAELGQVLKGLDLAVESGLPVKINTVLQKGVNDTEWEELAGLAEKRPVDVRFIELMPIGDGKEETGISNLFLLEKMKEKFGSLYEDRTRHGNGPARYVRMPGYLGSIGLISAMHGKFCSDCNRIRLTSTGEIKPCLCYGRSIPVRELLRGGDHEGLRSLLKQAVWEKPAEHCFTEVENITESRRMTEIGG